MIKYISYALDMTFMSLCNKSYADGLPKKISCINFHYNVGVTFSEKYNFLTKLDC